MSESRPQPLFIVGLETLANQELIQGVRDYVVRHRLDWPMVVAGCSGMAQRLDRSLIGTGTSDRPMLLGHINSPDLLDRAIQARLVVVTCCQVPEWREQVARVLPHAGRIGAAAADHLLANGWTRLKYWPTGHPREAAFVQRAGQRGVSATAIAHKAPGWSEAEVIEHLRSLPVGTAIFSSSDTLAVLVGHLCRAGGIPVPDHLGLLGSDNVADTCAAQRPTLSSVRVPWRFLGQRMALLAHRACCGEAWQGVTEEILPLGVQERDSTRRESTQDGWDGVFAAVAQWQRPHLPHLAQILGCSPRTAELRFKARCGMSLRAWHAHRRVQTALDLLLTGDLPVREIAHRCGYTSIQGLGDALRKTVGLGPRALRLQRGAFDEESCHATAAAALRHTSSSQSPDGTAPLL